MPLSPVNKSLSTVTATLAVLVATGCVSARIEEARHTGTGIEADDGIVILTQRQSIDYQTENGFVDCVSDALGAGARGLEMHPEQEFMDQLFPWFEPSYAPNHADGLRELLLRPGVAERIEQTGVRYLVWVDGSTQIVDGGGNLSCTIGAGGAGCFGFQWWENDSTYEAAIWDLETVEHAGTISTEAVGTSYMPAIIVPIPLIARTKAAACNGLANQLRDFLVASPAD